MELRIKYRNQPGQIFKDVSDVTLTTNKKCYLYISHVTHPTAIFCEM